MTHFGSSDMGGHFIAYCKHRILNEWYCYNDASVTRLSDQMNGYKKGVPYILFYESMQGDKNILYENIENNMQFYPQNNIQKNIININGMNLNYMNSINNINNINMNNFMNNPNPNNINMNSFMNNTNQNLNNNFNMNNNLNFSQNNGNNNINMNNNYNNMNNNFNQSFNNNINNF